MSNTSTLDDATKCYKAGIDLAIVISDQIAELFDKYEIPQNNRTRFTGTQMLVIAATLCIVGQDRKHFELTPLAMLDGLEILEEYIKGLQQALAEKK